MGAICDRDVHVVRSEKEGFKRQCGGTGVAAGGETQQVHLLNFVERDADRVVLRTYEEGRCGKSGVDCWRGGREVSPGINQRLADIGFKERSHGFGGGGFNERKVWRNGNVG